MTEETTQVENTQPEGQGINISVEQILAAVLKTTGDITVPLDNLILNYGNKQIAVNQNEDKSVVFSLVDAPQADNSEVTVEETEE